jgi:hypothetical protein
MNYRNGKLNLYGSYGNNISDNKNTGLLTQTEADLSQTFNMLEDRNSHLFKFGVDYYINEKNTLSIFTNQNIFDGGTLGETYLFPMSDPLMGYFKILIIQMKMIVNNIMWIIK